MVTIRFITTSGKIVKTQNVLGTQSIPFSHSALQDKKSGLMTHLYSQLCVGNHLKGGGDSFASLWNPRLER